MNIFVTGSTGAVGAQLMPLLLAQQDTVVALCRTSAKAKALAQLGATPVIVDPLNATALEAAVITAQPDVIIHQLTALSGVANFKRLDTDFALTNRFRTEVTDTLLRAAARTGTRRFIAQSFCGWPFARVGGPVKTEDDPLDPHPPAAFRKTLAALQQLEQAVTSATAVEALALRYGIFYGPGTSIAHDGAIIQMVRRGLLPIVGDGAGVWSFIHIADVARATVAAIRSGAPGVYNITDDEPAPVAHWLPVLAQAVGAKPPRTIPKWLATFLLGEGGVAIMTTSRGGSNAKAKRELGWQPSYPSWRTGFVNGLG